MELGGYVTNGDATTGGQGGEIGNIGSSKREPKCWGEGGIIKRLKEPFYA